MTISRQNSGNAGQVTISRQNSGNAGQGLRRSNSGGRQASSPRSSSPRKAGGNPTFYPPIYALGVQGPPQQRPASPNRGQFYYFQVMKADILGPARPEYPPPPQGGPFVVRAPNQQGPYAPPQQAVRAPNQPVQYRPALGPPGSQGMNRGGSSQGTTGHGAATGQAISQAAFITSSGGCDGCGDCVGAACGACLGGCKK